MMKKFFLSTVFALLLIVSMNAQDGSFKGGVHIGIPMGDSDVFSSFAAGVDISYIFNSGEEFEYGIASGFTNFFGKTEKIMMFGPHIEIEHDDYNYIPVAATAQYGFSEDFSLGLDLGYAFITSDSGGGDSGGLYYNPKVAWSASEKFDIVLAYRTMKIDSINISALTLGASFKF